MDHSTKFSLTVCSVVGIIFVFVVIIPIILIERSRDSIIY